MVVVGILSIGSDLVLLEKSFKDIGNGRFERVTDLT
jgi:hypothetical protein